MEEMIVQTSREFDENGVPIEVEVVVDEQFLGGMTILFKRATI